MCDRLEMEIDVQELIEQFQIDKVMSYRKSPALTPIETVFAIVADEKERRLDEFRWGLMPYWCSDAICADSELIAEKRGYDRMLRKQRCVIPCSGFAETGAASRYSSDEGKAIGLAGLYDIWMSPSGEEYRLCTLLTFPERSAEASGARLPAVLQQEDVEKWLDPSLTDKMVVQALLKPVSSEQVVKHTIEVTIRP